MVCAGIHMSEIPAFPYAILWGERELHSVANLARWPVHTSVTTYTLTDANEALAVLRAVTLNGAAVLIPDA